MLSIMKFVLVPFFSRCFGFIRASPVHLAACGFAGQNPNPQNCLRQRTRNLYCNSSNRVGRFRAVHHGLLQQRHESSLQHPGNVRRAPAHEAGKPYAGAYCRQSPRPSQSQSMAKLSGVHQRQRCPRNAYRTLHGTILGNPKIGS